MAFYDVSGLTEINIPNSVTQIDGAAFCYCEELKKLTIPRSVKSLGKYEDDDDDDVQEPATPTNASKSQYIKHIRKSNANAEEIVPIAVACMSLTSLTVEKGNDLYDSRDNCNAIIETASNTLLNGCVNTTIPNTVTNIGMAAFSGFKNLETIVIPNSVVNIGDYAFENTGLTHLTLPNSVINIGEGAFEETELTEVVIPNSVVNIGEGAFNGCDKLTTVYIPNSVKSIGNNAFGGWSAEGIKDIYSKIEEPFAIGESVFSDKTKNNGTLHVPYGLIEKYKVQEGWNKFVNIVEPKSGDIFKEQTIEGVEMTFTIISTKDKTCQVGTSSSAPAISNTTMGEVSVPAFADEYKVISVGEYAFLGCTGVTAVNLPASVVTLDDDSFRGCTSLTSFNVSESISYIGRRAFANCINLKDVYSEITNPFAIWDDSFPYDIATLHVPQGTKAKYKATKGWKKFKTIDSGVLEDGDVFAIQTKEGVYLTCQVINWQEKTCRVGDEETHDSALYSFDENDNPIEFEGDLTIPEKAMGYTIIRIETNALRRYKKLENVVIPNTVKSIGNYAFSECESLKEIILPNGLMEVGERAFNGCTSLQTVVIPNSVKSIGTYAFANCMGLYAVTSLVNIPFILDDSAFAIESNDYDRDIMYGIAKLYVPMGRASIYQQTTGWKKFLNIVEKTMSNKLTYMLDGVVYKTFDVQPGEVVTPEPDPVREGYDFSGWQGVPIIMPDHDVVVNGYFVPGVGISNTPVTKTMGQDIYNLSGQRVTHPHKGIYIKGGKKVVIK